MLHLIYCDLFSILALLFTINMAIRHVFEKTKRTKNYIFLAVILIIMLVLEITTYSISDRVNTALIIINRIDNLLGFILCPVFTYYLLIYSLHNDCSVKTRPLTIPVHINALLCIISYGTGWVFTVDQNNHYSRGPLFFIPILISFFYYFYMIIVSIKNRKIYEHGDMSALLIIISLPIFTSICQMLNPNIILVWTSASISFILYYVFLRELQFTRDIQTDVKNRAAFEKEMLQCIKRNKNVVIVSFDLNNLKQTNDKYGHKSGDLLLEEAAGAIKKCFDELGNTYRIGGDEFCVICEEVPSLLVKEALHKFDELLVSINRIRYNKLVIAYGYAVYDKDGSESLYAVLSKADRAMYNHKAKLKNDE